MPDNTNRTPAWNFRPTALSDDYKNASFSSLMKHYLRDASHAAKNGADEIPPKPQPLPGQKSFLRTCQWNIRYLSAPWLSKGGNGNTHAQQVADSILEVEPDVIILNEFGSNGRSANAVRVNHLAARLEAAGYEIQEANCSFPTAIASRLPISNFGRFKLNYYTDRAAVHMTGKLPQDGDECSSETAQSQNSAYVTIYGTHLDCSDDDHGSERLVEMKRLLGGIRSKSIDNESILIAGDFNQQRSCDYSKNEWKSICKNKAERGSPTSDGVAETLQGDGFTCCYDSARDLTRRNWTGNHPPSTHWSGTTIDYSYSRGSRISLQGMYVLPHVLSDHRMVVCDWEVRTHRE